MGTNEKSGAGVLVRSSGLVEFHPEGRNAPHIRFLGGKGRSQRKKTETVTAVDWIQIAGRSLADR
jgi:hypothetical protein